MQIPIDKVTNISIPHDEDIQAPTQIIFSFDLMDCACHYLPTKITTGPNMTHNSEKHRDLPPQICEIIASLGQRIRQARLRRNLTMEEMASRMFITRKTLARLEKGDPGVSMAIFTSALWVLGLENDLADIADPGQDKVGIFHEQKKLPKRARASKQEDDLDF